jgi:ParB family chromosome partitioning protein
MSKASSRLGRGLGSLIAGGTQAKTEKPSVTETTSDDLNLKETPKPSSKSNKNHHSGPELGIENLFEISTDLVIPNPYQPRKVIEPEAIVELAASIQAEGLLQPVVARKVGDVYELVAGERRWRAHQHLGRSKILVRVLSASDISSASLSLIENLQREGLNPIEEAMGYHSLINEFSLTQIKVAERVGKSRAHVANLLRLLQLDDDLKIFLSSQKLSVGHAKVLLGVEDVEARNKLGKKIVEEGLSVRECERAVLELRNPKKFSKKQSRNNPNLFSHFEKNAQQSLNRRVSIQSDNSGHGKITLSFSNETDLVQLLENLGVGLD